MNTNSESANTLFLRKHTRLLYDLVLDSINFKTQTNNSLTAEQKLFIRKKIMNYLRKNVISDVSVKTTGKLQTELLPLTCNCSDAVASLSISESDDFTFIWKYSFLSLASLVGLASIIFILVLVSRIATARINKKCSFSKSQKRLNPHLSTHSNSRSLLTRSILSSSSSPSLSSTSSPLNSPIRPSFFDIAFKNSKTTHLSYANKKDKRSHIFGIANRSFSDVAELRVPRLNDEEFINAYSRDRLVQDVSTSFRPMKNIYSDLNLVSTKQPTCCNREQINKRGNLSLSSSSSSTFTTNKKQNSQFEYDHLDTATNSINSDRISSLPELDEYDLEQQQQRLSQMMTIMPDFLNKAELMSRSSRITQELEARLRERRQVIERKASDQMASGCGVVRPKILQHIDILEMEAKQIRERANKSCCANLKHKLNHEHDSLEEVSDVFEKSSEVSKYEPEKNFVCECCESNAEVQNSFTKSANVDRKASKKMRLRNERPTVGVLLPVKRESIRMLYENRAVSENPLKSTLETHFLNINTSKDLRMKLGRIEMENGSISP